MCFRPEIGLSFNPGGVGIEAGCKGTTFNPHFAEKPTHRLFDSYPKQRIARIAVDPTQHAQKLGVVIQHFFKMRDEPFVVGGVTCKAATHMIVDAACEH